jgi:hypothetical protein
VSVKSDLGLKLCPRSWRPATNSQSYGHSLVQILCVFYFRTFTLSRGEQMVSQLPRATR